MDLAWWYYLAAFFAAAFLVNGVPHFTQGVAGKRFPTPFTGGPPNDGSPESNVLWGGGNFVVGGVLLWTIRDGLGSAVIVAELVVVGLVFSFLLARVFSRRTP